MGTPPSKPPPGSMATQPKLVRTLRGEALSPPPMWLMRQAGRYLPEYRAVRAEAGGFLSLVYDPVKAAEVTLQPIRRYGFDAAILFSDILVVPHALGQDLRFAEGEGPRLEPIATSRDLARLRPGATRPRYTQVAETVSRVKGGLPRETALIGFCGAPWTVATYMIAGEGTNDQGPARLLAYRERETVTALVDMLVETSIEYLGMQVEAGADALQIFDTWAGSLPDDELERWVIEPTARIVAAIRARHPEVPIIGFPRGAQGSVSHYLARTGVDAIGCDTAMPLERMYELGATGKAVQGNLDPLLLVAGGSAMATRVSAILAAMTGRPFIFNLGHGIVPQTPPEHVARLVELVRKGGNAL